MVDLIWWWYYVLIRDFNIIMFILGIGNVLKFIYKLNLFLVLVF